MPSSFGLRSLSVVPPRACSKNTTSFLRLLPVLVRRYSVLMFKQFATIVVLSIWCMSACGDDGGGANVCIENETQSCSCSVTEMGIQTCQADGTFSICECAGGPDAGQDEADASTAVNECTDQSDNCDLNATCTDTADSFTCQCNDGFVGDGVSCDADEASLVADFSGAAFQPTIEISGIGTYTIGGMSRVGVEIAINELPVSATRVQRSPGAVSYDDITMRLLSADSPDLSSLQTWITDTLAGTPSPRDVTLVLHGLGGQRVTLNLLAVVPTAGDTTIANLALAEVVLRPSAITLNTYQSPFPEPPEPTPGTRVEISGVNVGNHVILDGDLVSPIEDATTPLIAWRHLNPIGSDGIVWALQTISIVEADPINLDRRDLSVVTVDGIGDELARVNSFECWPYRINFFNPARPYAARYLIDLFISFDFAENG